MMKQWMSFLLVSLCMAVLFSGCRPAAVRQSLETTGNPSPASCYRIDFLGVTESSEVASTWRYRVEQQACAQKLSKWVLELPACASVVYASPGDWKIVSPGSSTQLSGIEWQTATDFQSGEFSVTLTGDLGQGMTRAGLEGQGLSMASLLDGPVCKDRAAAGSSPTSSPGTSHPVAKVKVQSANCRDAPVGGAKKIALLYRNQEAEIVGRNEDPNNPWWYVKIPDRDGNCWLWGKTTTTSGNLDGLPVVK